MASSKKYARFISSTASIVYFLIIFLQVPLFRVPCRNGICTTPIEVTSSQLIASQILPEHVAKTLLYPGAAANAIFRNKSFPSFGDLSRIYELADAKILPGTTDLQRLEVLAGCYFAVASALFGLLRPTKMSLSGILLLLWGLLREVIFGKQSYLYSNRPIHIYPAMPFAALSAFLSIRKDVRKILRSFRARRIAKSQQGETKIKFT